MRKNWFDFLFLAAVLVVCSLAAGLVQAPRPQAPTAPPVVVKPSGKPLDARQATNALSAVLAPVSAPTSVALQYFRPIKD